MISTNELTEALEALMNETSLTDILDALSDVCYTRSEQVVIADVWNDAAAQLAALSNKLTAAFLQHGGSDR